MLYGMPYALSKGRLNFKEQIDALGLGGSTLKLCLDFAAPECYPGTGENIFDLSGSNNNFVRGNTSATGEAGDPTFVGSPGDPKDQNFSNGVMTLAAATNSAELNSLSQPNTQFSYVAWVKTAATNAVAIFETTQNTFAAGNFGIDFFATSAAPAGRVVRSAYVDASARQVVTTATTPVSTWCMVSITQTNSTTSLAGAILIGINTTFQLLDTVGTPWSTSPSSGKMTIGLSAQGSVFGSSALWTGRRLTQAEITSIYDATRSRYGV